MLVSTSGSRDTGRRRWAAEIRSRARNPGVSPSMAPVSPSSFKLQWLRPQHEVFSALGAWVRFSLQARSESRIDLRLEHLG